MFDSTTDLTRDTYVLDTEADAYFDRKLDKGVWCQCPNTDKNKAIYEATERIDRLKFRGTRTTPTQVLAFPRDGEIVIPNVIKKACCEVAYELLDGREPDFEVEEGRILSESYSGVRMNNNPGYVLDHINAGIPSLLAWSYLKPYLVDPFARSLVRV